MMQRFTNMTYNIGEVISPGLILQSAALAPMLGFLRNFFFDDWQFLSLAVLAVCLSVLIEMFCSIYKRAFNWDILFFGALRGFIYASVLLITHTAAHNKTTSAAINAALEYTDWVFYALIIFIELRLIVRHAKAVGIDVPDTPLKALENIFNNHNKKA